MKEQLINELDELRVEERTAKLVEANEKLRQEIEERKRAEEALWDSEVQKSAILDTSIDRIRYVDKNMRIVWANKTTAAGLNMSPEDLVGQTCHELFVGRDTPCEGCPTQRAQETGQIERAVMYKPKVKGMEGGSYWDVYCSPLRNRAGNIEDFIQISRNITAQKLSEFEILRKNALFEGINKVFRETLICETEDEVAKTCLAVAEELTGSKFSFIANLNETGRLDCLAVSDPGWYACQMPESDAREALENLKIRGYWAKIINDRKALIVNDPASHLDRIGTPEGHPQITSFMGIPLIHAGNTLGMIALANKEGGYDSTDQETMESLGVAIVESLRNKRAEKHIHSLAHQLIRAQESERQMISRELHDRVGQDLSTLKIGIDTLVDHEPSLSPEVRKTVLQYSEILQKAIGSVRDLSYDLHPPGLADMGLIQVLSMYCEEFAEKNGVKLNFEPVGMSNFCLDSDTAVNVYRLVQEGLNNIWKHAAASQATVMLVGAYPNIILRIEDNGKGFDVQKRALAADGQRRMGLRSMAERVALMQGEMTIQSQSMKGTRIFIKFPYQEKKIGSKENHIDCR